MVADQLSRLGQTIQREWSLLPEVFHLICNRWHQPQIDLFATRFNKLLQFVSSVPDSQAWTVDALSRPWECLVPYTFSPIAILGKVVAKLKNYRRIIQIAPGLPNMPFVLGPSGHVKPDPTLPVKISKLLTQPFN